MPGTAHADLTRGERRVLGLLLDGVSYSQAALRLHVDASTLRWHVKNLHAKTDTHTGGTGAVGAAAPRLLRRSLARILTRSPQK